jgi:hypothetical protein
MVIEEQLVLQVAYALKNAWKQVVRRALPLIVAWVDYPVLV